MHCVSPLGGDRAGLVTYATHDMHDDGKMHMHCVRPLGGDRAGLVACDTSHDMHDDGKTHKICIV